MIRNGTCTSTSTPANQASARCTASRPPRSHTSTSTSGSSTNGKIFAATASASSTTVSRSRRCRNASTAPTVSNAGNRSYVLRNTGPTSSGDTAATAAARATRESDAPTASRAATSTSTAAAPQSAIVHLKPGAKAPGSRRTTRKSGCASGGYTS